MTPLLLLPLTTKKNWGRMLLFTLQYMPLIEYEKGIHVLLLSIFILDVKGRWLHSTTLSQLPLILYCLAALLITLYNDLRLNGSDVFAVFFYANCLVFVVHSLAVAKTIDSLLCSTNMPPLCAIFHDNLHFGSRLCLLRLHLLLELLHRPVNCGLVIHLVVGLLEQPAHDAAQLVLHAEAEVPLLPQHADERPQHGAQQHVQQHHVPRPQADLLLAVGALAEQQLQTAVLGMK